MNLYAYVSNNPVNSIDTDGRLTIILPGTWWKASDWNYKTALVGEATRHFHEHHQTWLDLWDPRGDKNKDRQNAAYGLRWFINHYKFAPGEGLFIVAHSHGGNVALQAAALGLNHKIDVLITLGTPFGFESMNSGIRKWYNITGSGDEVLPFASVSCGDGSGVSCQIQKGAQNYTVQAPSHTSLWSDDKVRALWWNWVMSQLESGAVQGPTDKSQIVSPICPKFGPCQ
jgi:hypothetical protein